MQGEETPGRVSKKFLKANARQLRRAEARSLKSGELKVLQEFQGGDDNGSQGKNKDKT